MAALPKKALGQVELWRTSGVVGQLVRFGFTGVAVTAFYECVYLPIAIFGQMWFGHGAVWPLVAGTVAFIAAAAVGHVAHSRISFKDHGSRDKRTAHRFLVVQLIGFAFNQCFIWLLTGPLLHGPAWWPVVPTVFVTPLVTFGLQRNWVFA